MNTQTQSNHTPPAPRKEDPLPDHVVRFSDLTNALNETIDENACPSALDPDFGTHVDIHLLLQQCALIQNLNLALAIEPFDHRIASNIRQTLALIEKTRARQERNRLKETDREYRESILQPDREEARIFLTTELAKGERPAADLLKLSRTLGIAPATLRRAKSSLNITSIQRHNPDKTRCWMWSIPTAATTPSQTSTSSETSAASECTNSSLRAAASNGSIKPQSSTSTPDSPDSRITALVPPVSTGGMDNPATPHVESTLQLSATIPASEFFSPLGSLPSSLHPAQAELLENHFSGDQVINQNQKPALIT